MSDQPAFGKSNLSPINSGSSADKRKNSNITRKDDDREKANQKKQKLEYVVSGKSDIIVSLNDKWVLPIIEREKTHEFRKWKADIETKRMWIYVNRPVSKLMYIFEIDHPVEYPNQIPEDNIHNRLFNQGKKSSFAYRIKHLYKLDSPIDAKMLKRDYCIHPPQKFTYVSRYPQLANDIIIGEQTKLF
ncbi:10060_t:CDS:1 [Cetraspora pellucida]|uniref:10060_t:CDS:1 n=1 Tax=Cetraspora pellucida TaxID=1433469 RepID=A0A9N9IGC8_9GLOM|nr:10060_t:CDS:1 [Cetraspora pellucida]